jgi:hypothetical protein
MTHTGEKMSKGTCCRIFDRNDRGFQVYGAWSTCVLAKYAVAVQRRRFISENRRLLVLGFF